jgi:glycine cleavage system H lipoate-binding protein
MFPGVDGFHWTVGHVVFVSAFVLVFLTVATTVTMAFFRTRMDLAKNRDSAIRWHSDFEDLPRPDRSCRHEMAGEVADRACPNAFDCRHCSEHPRFARIEDSTRMYHRGHTWVEVQPDGTAIIGLDDFAMRLIGKPDMVELPPPGTRVLNNGAGWRMRKEDVHVRVLAPIDGEVVETGGPEQGWYLRVKPDSNNFAHLLRGGEVDAWMGRELQKLQLRFAPSLADGGELAADVMETIPNANWDDILGHVFLDP